jgi:CRP/FNR family cyclic AMP-dependent transcriptional regulator
MGPDTAPQLEQGRRDALAAELAAHPFTTGFDAPHVDVLCDLAGEVELAEGEFVLRRGQLADTLYLLVEGDVALEVGVGGEAPLAIQTLHAGDVLGWSWLWPPYEWHLDARARTGVRAIAIDAVALRHALAEDPVLGCVVAMRVGAVLSDRVRHARERLASSTTA